MIFLGFWACKLVEKPKFKQHPPNSKAFSSPEHIYKNVEHHGKLTSLQRQS